MTTKWTTSAATLALTLAALSLATPSIDAAFGDRFGGSESPQTASAPPTAENGRCPQKRASTTAPSFMAHRRALRGARQIVLPDATVYSDAELFVSVRGLKLHFQDRVRVLRWNEGSQKSHFVKFDTPQGPRCGWIEQAALLPEGRDGPLMIRDLQRAGIEGFTGEGSTLEAKVLVRNRFDKDDRGAATGARVYLRYTDAIPYKTLRIFNVLNVFEFVEYRGQVWYFVGGEKSTQRGGVEQFLYGWVKAEEVIPWSTLINVYYNPKKTGDIFIYEDDTEAELKGTWFAKRGSEAEPADRSISRFPLLDTNRHKGLALHLIAFPGIACDSQGRCISAQRNDLQRGEIADDLWKAENIDFLFVIDATESMRKYFRPVVKGVRDFMRAIDTDNKEQVRFSVVTYGDFLNKDINAPDFQFSRVIPFGSPNNDAELNYLLTAETFSDNIQDYPEAAFASLDKAIREAAWREKAGWRMVVWISDHPNRGPEIASNRETRYWEEDVASALQSIENGVWTAINVKGNYKPALNNKSVAQAEEILRRSGGFGLPPRRAYDPSSGGESPAEVSKSVKGQLQSILDSGKKVPEILALMAEGKDLTTLSTDLPGAVLAIDYVKNRLSLDGDQIREFFQRSQLVREGWIRQEPDDPDFLYWVSVKPHEMDDMVEAADDLCETLGDDPPDFDRVKDAMIAMLRSVTGDVPKTRGADAETKIRSYLSKRLHVPVEQFSPLLSKNIDEFVYWYNDTTPQQADEFRHPACKKAALLRMALNGSRVDGGLEDLYFNERNRRWEAHKGKALRFNWVWGTEHGIHYYYIPLDYVL